MPTDRPAPPEGRPPRRPGRLALPAALLVLTLGAHLWLIGRWSPPAQAATAPALRPVLARVAEPPAPPAPRPMPVAVPVAAADPTPAEPATRAAADRQAPARVTAVALAASRPAPARRARAGAAASSTSTSTSTATPASSGDGLRAPAAPERLQPPASAQLHYRMSRGALTGSGLIEWDSDGHRYRMQLQARVPVFGVLLEQRSEGRIDASGVAPERHTERRLRRSERAVSFVRDDGRPRVLFSAREGESPLQPGTQDRLSWIAQLAAWIERPGRTAGTQLTLPVAGVGGEVHDWTFTLIDRDEAGRWHLRREPDGPHDTHAEVWTLPQPPYWPQRLRLSDDGGDVLELLLQPGPGGADP